MWGAGDTKCIVLGGAARGAIQPTAYSLLNTGHWKIIVFDKMDSSNSSDRGVNRYNFFLCEALWPFVQSLVCPSWRRQKYL